MVQSSTQYTNSVGTIDSKVFRDRATVYLTSNCHVGNTSNVELDIGMNVDLMFVAGRLMRSIDYHAQS